MVRDGERGYALLPAIVAVTALAYIAFQVLAVNQGSIDEVAARIEQTQLAAAADAGVDLAIHALATEDGARDWPIDGRARQLDFDGVDLTVAVEDERGKAPLNDLDDSQARILFTGGGASGDRLDALVAEFRDWLTADQSAPASGPAAPVPGGAAAAMAPRHGPFRTVGELSALKDMDPVLFARIAPAVTVFFENSGGFEPRNAQPLPIAVMATQGGGGPNGFHGENDSSHPQPAQDTTPDTNLIGRALTIRVTARARDGAHTHRMAIVELTGDKAQPYWARYME